MQRTSFLSLGVRIQNVRILLRREAGGRNLQRMKFKTIKPPVWVQRVFVCLLISRRRVSMGLNVFNVVWKPKFGSYSGGVIEEVLFSLFMYGITSETGKPSKGRF